MDFQKLTLALALSMIVAASEGGATNAPAAAPAADEPAYAQRWQDLKGSLFADRIVSNGGNVVDLNAPARATDAARVPIALAFKGDRPLKGIYLIIDNNPAPLAGHFEFGPQGDPRTLQLNVRVDQYTYIHAVAETRDGQLYSVARFVKASGGCSAPPGADERIAMQGLGRIEFELLQPYVAGKVRQARVMIHHPNFNGMQMNQLTHLYTPAMFIRSIDINYDGTRVLRLDSDISLSSDPVIEFEFLPSQPGQLQVLVRDTHDATFGQSFPVPPPG